ncbi:MAG TPA: phosphatidylserine decarboxylase [Gemmataceae bacterium]|nr:phosphatidylserine decarboxylase [Gemmataceae bacterium]
MATVQRPAAPVRQPAPLTSAQPGGGLGMRLELAWGRLRRAWLRRFRPGYVRRMADKRQGDCPGCPHDVIDPRDLKFYRNVCGYWFRPEDDPFRWRGQLGLARAGLAEVVLFSALLLPLAVLFGAAGALVHPLFGLPTAAVAVLWLGVVWFFRDPDRTIPTDPALLLSPADGTITHIDEVDEPDFPGGRALRVSIFLSIFNVHVNRMPQTARVVGLRYFPGCFLYANHADCFARNEQLWIDLEEEGTGRPLRVKQIAGVAARRIVCWLRSGETVSAGERFGMIKFGSRTEVYVPANEAIELLVKVGDRVKGGSRALLRFRPQGAS